MIGILKREDGQAVLETALVIPVIIFIFYPYEIMIFTNKGIAIIEEILITILIHSNIY